MAHFESEYDHEKVLSMCRDDFDQDFELIDVYRDLENGNVLTLSDLKAIWRCSNKRERIDKLFFLLVIRGDKAFQNFLCELKKTYSWLALKIEQDLNNVRGNHNHNHNHRQPIISNQYYPDDTRDAFYEKILRLRKELPKFEDFNIHRCELV